MYVGANCKLKIANVLQQDLRRKDERRQKKQNQTKQKEKRFSLCMCVPQTYRQTDRQARAITEGRHANLIPISSGATNSSTMHCHTWAD